MKEFLLKIKNIKITKGFILFKKINPHKHWKTLLHFFSILILILVIFSFYLLYKINNQQIFQATNKSVLTSSLINEKLLKRITESFDAKLIKEKEVKEGLKVYKDPSI